MFPSNGKLAILLLATSSLAQAQEWTEQALLALFDQQSPIRRETQAAAAAAVEVVRARTLWPNPTASYSRETVGFTEFVLAEQQLPISGRLRFERQALEPARQTIEAEGAARLWDARSSLRAAFFRALSAQQQTDVIRSALSEINAIIDVLRAREELGEGSHYDRIRVEREAAEMRADLALAAARARSERAALLAYLPPQTIVNTLLGNLTSRTISGSREEIMRRALESRAEVRAESTRLVQFGFERQAADRLRFSEPIVAAGLKRTQIAPNINDTGAVVSISVPLPVFNKGRTEVARLSAEQQRTEARRDLLAQQITATVSGAYDVYIARLEALQEFERETGESGQELLRIARVGYEEGDLGILQLLDAYRVRRQTQLRRLELESAVKDIEIELSRVAGYEVTQ